MVVRNLASRKAAFNLGTGMSQGASDAWALPWPVGSNRDDRQRPDLVFVPESSRHGITDRGVELPPGLIVEILSPTSASIDRVKKPRRYGDFGVPEYWVADPEEKVVWVWRFAAGESNSKRIEDEIGWRPSGAHEDFRMQLTELFRPM